MFEGELLRLNMLCINFVRFVTSSGPVRMVPMDVIAILSVSCIVL